jgi:hypothetical protein
VESNWFHSALRPPMAYCASPGWLWWLSNRWNDWQGKPKYSEKTCPSTALSTTTPHAARTRTRAAAVGSQRLIAELQHGLFHCLLYILHIYESDCDREKYIPRFWWIYTFWTPRNMKKRFLECRLCICMYTSLAPQLIDDFIHIRYLRVYPTQVGGARWIITPKTQAL